MNLGGNRSKLQKAPFQLFVQALLCLIIVLASYMSSNDNTTEARSNASRNPMQSTPSRGKFVGNSFNAKDLFLAYKEIESTYHQVAFAETSQHLWRTLVDKNDVEVALMEHQSDPRCPYVRMAVEIDVPVEDCWEFLSLHNWDKTMPKMDPFYEGVELHGEFSHKRVHMILARKRTDRILAFGKRDFVFLSVTDEPLADGTWVSGTVSVQTPKLPRQEGYVRAFQDSIAFYKPISENRTKITIVCRIDLNDSADEAGAGGWIPMWLYVKTVGISGAKSVISMRKYLVEARDELQRSRNFGVSHEEVTKKKKRLFLPWRKASQHQQAV